MSIRPHLGLGLRLNLRYPLDSQITIIIENNGLYALAWTVFPIPFETVPVVQVLYLQSYRHSAVIRLNAWANRSNKYKKELIFLLIYHYPASAYLNRY
jgi:hypothetical protein